MIGSVKRAAPYSGIPRRACFARPRLGITAHHWPFRSRVTASPPAAYQRWGGVQRDAVSVDSHFLHTMAERFLVGKAFVGLSTYSRERGFFTDSPRQGEILSAIASLSQSLYLLLESQRVGKNGKYTWHPGKNRPRITEICVDEDLSVEVASREFPDGLPVAICGDSYVIESPFDKQYVVGFAALHGRRSSPGWFGKASRGRRNDAPTSN